MTDEEKLALFTSERITLTLTAGGESAIGAVNLQVDLPVKIAKQLLHDLFSIPPELPASPMTKMNLAQRKEIALKMVKNGATEWEIAQATGVSVDAARRYISGEEITRSRPRPAPGK